MPSKRALCLYLPRRTQQPTVSSISPARMHRKAELIQVPSRIPTPSAIMQHPCSCLFRHTQKTPPAQSMQGGVSACQKSLAEFGGVSRQIKSNHFLSGRVPDRKYISGCKSSAAALCRAQPPQAALSASLCELFAIGEQGVRAADCKKLVGKARKGFSDSLKHPPHSLCRGCMLYG